MLAMSEMAFGQKEGKVLWENAVDTITTGAYINDVGGPLLSPLGNILVQFNYILNNNIRKSGVKLYDKNGKIIWDAKDFYQNASTGFGTNVQNQNYTLLYNSYSSSRNGSNTVYDSTLYLGKDFNVLKKFEMQKPTSYLTPVDDGVFYYDNNKSLVKYNIEGKEEWRYDSNYPIIITTKKAPYVGSILLNTINKEGMIAFNKNGKVIVDSSQLKRIGDIYETKDKGFWYKNNSNYEYIKFDSSGKEITKYLGFQSLRYQFAAHTTVLPDNSILLDVMKDNGILLIKVSPLGEVREYNIPAIIKFKDFRSTFIFKALESENKIMYSLRLQETEQAEADIKYKIGVVDFDNSANSWNKDVRGGASNGTYGNTFTFEAENTFFQVYPSPINPPMKFFKVYDIKGNLTWESPFYVPSARTQTDNWRVIGEHLYVSRKVFNDRFDGCNKITFANGKDLWSRKDISFANGFLKDLQKDKDGNDVILYFKYEEVDGKSKAVYKIETLNPDGSGKWQYILGRTDNFEYQFLTNTYFKPTNDGKLIVYSAETGRNFILRKITPCEDLNALTITGNTEACPTEKVKLSIPKQEGITYQWQKDGKDIPNVKDVVYDFGESGTYTVVAKDELCQNTVTSNALKINIRSFPTAEITAPKTTFCDGEKTTIASKTNGTFFQWQKDGKDVPNATSGIYEVSQAGDYRVGVRDDKCPQVGYSNIYTIITKLLPEATILTDIKGVVYEPFTVKMSANSGTNLAYQWLKDDAIIPNETKLIYEAKKSGKYNVIVMQDGCEKRSDALTISILIPLANQEEIGEEVVQVYPNPSKGEFKIILPKSLKSADIQLFDTFGRERSLVYVGEQAQAEGLGQGVYFLRVQKGEKAVTSKLVIE